MQAFVLKGELVSWPQACRSCWSLSGPALRVAWAWPWQVDRGQLYLEFLLMCVPHKGKVLISPTTVLQQNSDVDSDSGLQGKDGLSFMFF